MLKMLTAVVVLASVLGARSAAVEPNKCCLSQFTANLGEEGAYFDPKTNYTSMIEGGGMMAFDFPRKRQVTYSRIADPTTGTDVTYMTFMDYQNRMKYSRQDNGACTGEPMGHLEMMLNCVPAGARYVGPAKFGYGAFQLNVNTWQFNNPISTTEAQRITMSFTRDGCIPVFEAIVGNMRGNNEEVTLFFTGYKPSIDDPKLLDIPADCKPAN